MSWQFVLTPRDVCVVMVRDTRGVRAKGPGYRTRLGFHRSSRSLCLPSFSTWRRATSPLRHWLHESRLERSLKSCLVVRLPAPHRGLVLHQTWSKTQCRRAHHRGASHLHLLRNQTRLGPLLTGLTSRCGSSHSQLQSMMRRQPWSVPWLCRLEVHNRRLA
jgi:hypothetical protein